jgi:hypothetical protein
MAWAFRRGDRVGLGRCVTFGSSKVSVVVPRFSRRFGTECRWRRPAPLPDGVAALRIRRIGDGFRCGLVRSTTNAAFSRVRRGRRPQPKARNNAPERAICARVRNVLRRRRVVVGAFDAGWRLLHFNQEGSRSRIYGLAAGSRAHRSRSAGWGPDFVHREASSGCHAGYVAIASRICRIGEWADANGAETPDSFRNSCVRGDNGDGTHACGRCVRQRHAGEGDIHL